MSDRSVRIEEIVSVIPHPNADKLELAQICEYRTVVPRGVYRAGEYAVYIPEQVLLPEDLLEELGLTGRLSGPQKNRVKCIRLRGEYSQGIVCRPRKVSMELAVRHGSGYWSNIPEPSLTMDWSDVLGIQPWIPKPPQQFGVPNWEPAPDLIHWIDIQNVARYPGLFTPGEDVVATEKIHGTCLLFTYDVDEGRSYVSSKGVGAKSLALKDENGNIYWEAAKKYNLEESAKAVAKLLGLRRVGIFGEVYGPGVQDLTYGEHERRFAAFDLYGVSIHINNGLNAGYWISPDLLISLDTGVPISPVLYEGPYDYELLADLAEGRTVIGNGACIREGLVVRPYKERYSFAVGGRAIGKIISKQYLTRTGGTEYE